MIKIWKGTTVEEGVEIEDDVVIGSCCFIGSGTKIGSGTRIQHGVFIPRNTRIGKGVFIGPGTVLLDDKYPIAGNKEHYLAHPPVLEDGCSIGGNCTILPGVIIGKMALVGAGTVVRYDVGTNITIVNGLSDRVLS